jgi:predicted ATP-grasp superfamily ATP-dependent carboligase
VLQASEDHKQATASVMPPAVVLGGGINALAVVQSLGRRGIRVYVVPDAPDDLVLRSRHATQLRLETDDRHDETLTDALLLSARSFETQPVLFFTSDTYLRLVARHRERLSNAFLFHVPTIEQVDTVTDKALFAQFAERHGLPTPRTVVPTSLIEVEALSQRFQYPAVLKPNLSARWRARDEKIVKVEDAGSMIAQWEALKHTSESLIVQEFIDSDDSEHFSFCAYRSPNRGELAALTVQKLRVLPIHGGVGVFLRVVHDVEMEQAGRHALEALDYVGVASVCFKTQAMSGRRLIHEINGRLPAWHDAFRISGVDLPFLMYSDLVGLDSALAHNGAAEGKWVTLAGDVRAFVNYNRSGELSLRSWLASYRGVKIWAELALDDRPLIYDLVRRAANALRRSLSRRLSSAWSR